MDGREFQSGRQGKKGHVRARSRHSPTVKKDCIWESFITTYLFIMILQGEDFRDEDLPRVWDAYIGLSWFKWWHYRHLSNGGQRGEGRRCPVSTIKVFMSQGNGDNKESKQKGKEKTKTNFYRTSNWRDTHTHTTQPLTPVTFYIVPYYLVEDREKTEETDKKKRGQGGGLRSRWGSKHSFLSRIWLKESRISRWWVFFMKGVVPSNERFSLKTLIVTERKQYLH